MESDNNSNKKTCDQQKNTETPVGTQEKKAEEKAVELREEPVTEQKDVDDDEGPTYSSKWSFLLTTIGFAVGLGNFWRFPMILQDNGGGAFLVPYLIFFLIGGVPLLFMELSLGQMIRKGNIKTWMSLHPSMAGIGVCGMMISFLIQIYYSCVLGWVAYYLGRGTFAPSTTLPWSVCPEGSILNVNSTTNVSSPMVNVTSDGTPICHLNETAKYFWFQSTLHLTPDMSTHGGIQWHIYLSVVVAWALVYLAMCKGLKTFEKAVKFTTVAPIAILVVLLIHALTLNGSFWGIRQLIKPNLEKLMEYDVWVAAASQIFFSLSIGFGGMVAFASKQKRDSNVQQSAWIIACVNSLVSLSAAMIVFSVRGFEAYEPYRKCVFNNMEVLNVSLPENGALTSEMEMEYDGFYNVNPLYNSTENFKVCNATAFLEKTNMGGSGLAFVVFAQTLGTMGVVGRILAPFFFLTLLLLGIASIFGNVEGVLDPLGNLYEIVTGKKFNYRYALTGLVGISIVLNLIFVGGNGSYWLDLFDTYCGNLPLVAVAVTELIALRFFFGFDKLMLGLEKYRPRGNSIFERLSRGFLKITLSGVSLFTLGSVALIKIYEMFTKPKVYGAIDVYNRMAISKIPYGGFHIFVAILLTILCIGAIPAAVIGSRFSKFRRFCNRKVNSDIGPVKMTELEKSTEEDETNCQDVEAGDV